MNRTRTSQGDSQPGATRRDALGLLAGSVVAACATPLLSACSAPVAPLRVGSIVFPGYELLFLARDLDWIDARQARLIEMRSNTDTIRALASSQLDLAAMTLDELMTARADGVDLRAVMVFDVSAGADVVLARDGVTLQTLAGKRVGVEDGAMGAVMLSALLGAANLSLDQIKKVPMLLDRSEDAFGALRLDAVVTAEPWAARLEKKGANRIFDSKSIPGRIVDVLAARAEVIETHAKAIKHVVAAYFQAQKYWLAAPVDAARRMAPRLQVAPEEVSDQFRGLKLPDLAENAAMLRQGGQFDATTQELQRVMLEAGLLPKSAAIRNLADSRFLPK